MNLFKNFGTALMGSALFFLACFLFISAPVHAEETGETSTSIVRRNPIYHVHTGGSGGGGCYTIHRTGTRTYTEQCSGTRVYWPLLDTTQCSVCGASYYGANNVGSRCTKETTREESYSYYDLGCGKSGSTLLGYVTYTVDTTEWVKEVHVDISIENIGMTISQTPYRENGSNSDTGSFTVTENGTYTYGINADANSGTGAANFTVTITNIDHTAPIIPNYDLQPTDWVKEGVLLTLEPAVDYQPDMSMGCGLPDNYISYDNGQTWSAELTHFYEDNGDYEILVRDKLDNIGGISFTIDNIDHEAPNITTFTYDDTMNIRSTVLNVECNDLLSDSREGVGLADLPFSYDGGTTWTDIPHLDITHNMDIHFIVRDKLDNRAERILTITNIDDYKPNVSHILYPGYWTNQDVTVTFIADDRRPDNIDGVGLPDDCFSYDSGKTWTSEDSISVSENGDVKVAVRDKNGNTNYYSFTLESIDKTAPSISASYVLTDDSFAAVLSVSASDAESGIDYNSIVWNGDGVSMSGSSVIVERNGAYTVSVKDKAGNEATAGVFIGDINEKIINRILDAFEDDVEDNGIFHDGNLPPVYYRLPPLQASHNDSTMDTLTDNDTRSWLERLSDRISEWWNSLSFFEKALIVFSLLGLIFGIFFLIFLYYRSVWIYSEIEDERFMLLGIKAVFKEEGIFVLKLSEKLLAKSTTVRYRLRFSRLFAHIHEGENINIITENAAVTSEISRLLELEL